MYDEIVQPREAILFVHRRMHFMFHIFKRAEVDKDKVTDFVNWFQLNEERIRKSVENKDNDHDGMMDVLDEVENQLAQIYRDGYAGNIEFDYGGKDQNWELNLYHLNKRFLVEATKIIEDEFNLAHIRFWKINIGK